MVDRAITRFVDVVITKENPTVTAAGFGTLLVLSDSDLLTTTTRVKSFSTDTAVSTFFGSSSEEYLYANAFFNQDASLENHPDEIIFGRYADADTVATLECGDSPLTVLATWQAVTDGEFTVDIDGGTVNLTSLDFSTITSLDDVATVIDTALGVNGSCYYQINKFVFESATTGASSTITLLDTVAVPAGTDISGSSYLDGDVAKSGTNPGGSVLSQGQAAETVAAAITAIENVNNDWYALGALKKFRDVSATEDMADEIESRRKMFLIATNDANTLVSGSTSTFAYYLKNANYKRSACIYHDNSTLYPDSAWLGLQLPKTIGQTNWAFKTLPGIAEGADVDIDPVTLTEDQKTNALAVNANLYSTTLGADFTYNGTMGGGRNADKDGEYIDIIRNIDFLQARIEEDLMSLLLEVDIIPYTNGGISIVDNRLKSSLNTYGVIQGILVDGTVETTVPKRSDTTQANRDDRILPDVKFQGELTGGINKVVVRGQVFI